MVADLTPGVRVALAVSNLLGLQPDPLSPAFSSKALAGEAHSSLYPVRDPDLAATLKLAQLLTDEEAGAPVEPPPALSASIRPADAAVDAHARAVHRIDHSSRQLSRPDINVNRRNLEPRPRRPF